MTINISDSIVTIYYVGQRLRQTQTTIKMDHTALDYDAFADNGGLERLSNALKANIIIVK